LSALLVLLFAAPLGAQSLPPVLDMHLHAMGANDQGPAPIPVCAPFTEFPAWDAEQPYPTVFMVPPPCDDPIWSPSTDEDLRRETIEVMETNNVVGVLSGPPHRVASWVEAAPGRFIRGLGFRLGPQAPSPDSLRHLVASGAVEVLAEVTNQYAGLEPDDPAMRPYWALAEQLDVPVGIHMGPGPPGAAYLSDPTYRASLGNPLLLEDVLVRHPRLRVYIMHAGYPFLDDLKALLYAYPQVHVEVGVVSFTRPRADFYRFLEELVEAGFESRIMFGSDQMNWPEAIVRSVQAIQDAPFLSESQKRAILYENGARFLRLSEAERAAHWGR
jgi:predicted TIM-barrel fold metal-dependent hydrolase